MVWIFQGQSQTWPTGLFRFNLHWFLRTTCCFRFTDRHCVRCAFSHKRSALTQTSWLQRKCSSATSHTEKPVIYRRYLIHYGASTFRCIVIKAFNTLSIVSPDPRLRALTKYVVEQKCCDGMDLATLDLWKSQSFCWMLGGKVVYMISLVRLLNGIISWHVFLYQYQYHIMS